MPQHIAIIMDGNRSGAQQQGWMAIRGHPGGAKSARDIMEEWCELYTRGLPEPDLLIRTGGEMRISNFLPWQIAYAELWVTPTLWPDFNPAELHSAIGDFQKRERRFGGVNAQ